MFMMEAKASLTYKKKRTFASNTVFIDFYLLLSILQIMETWEKEWH